MKREAVHSTIPGLDPGIQRAADRSTIPRLDRGIPGGIVIAADDPRGAEARALIEASDRMSMARYKPEERYPVDVNQLAGPDFTFFVARVDGTAVGCAALRRFAGYGELKRMYVREEARRRGIGQALLLRVEDAARAAGLPVLRLETGIYQHEALPLYRGAGYRDCGRFGDYRPNQTSIYLEKSLAGDSPMMRAADRSAVPGLDPAPPDGIVIAVETPLQADVRAMVTALNDYLIPLTPREFQFQLTAEQMAEPAVTVFVARDGAGRPIGMGALKDHGGGLGEVKRMLTLPEIRGKRVGSLLLRRIEALARERGIARLVLETGEAPGFELAWRVYERGGFTVCGAVLDYPDSGYSRFYEKNLSA